MRLAQAQKCQNIAAHAASMQHKNDYDHWAKMLKLGSRNVDDDNGYGGLISVID